VQTAFKAVLTFEEHEIREHFLYKNRPVFSPHYDVEYIRTIMENHPGKTFEVR